MKHLHLVSLGCPKNLVDSEIMLALLEADGYTVVEEPAAADLVLVNTCGFIQPAVEEAVDEILRLAAVKEERPAQLLVVTGCMVQRYGAELARELPEVDLFLGVDDFPLIVEHLRAHEQGRPLALASGPSSYIMDATVPRTISTPLFRSYLKITEGCDNHCSYCMIPSIRGPLRSRGVNDLVAEAMRLEELGVRELTLIAQDLTAYGDDLGEEASLVTLLQALLKETSIPWFRLLYLYPSSLGDDLLALMAAQPRILPYLDIPFQHASDPVLRRMNRRYTTRELNELVSRIRTMVPECSLRTTMLVGFPGETEADVELLLECLARWQFDHVGVFQYQDEEGSAAARLDGKVEEEEKEVRYQRVMELQAKISLQRQQRLVGRVEEVLVEGLSRESDLLLEGRTRFQAPDIDGCVYITSGQVNPGDIVPVRITEAHPYDLVGEVVSAAELP
ncbi:30S ribosomal protein S12 methylthiotransferase RimO [Desulfogranum mediterraneum]|uniref:30S ribosomal protein S12 methylthiotransferase RimO n=1 Tax=Desulfogranum mediterraneum TaxID=160661 RepID=UPI0003F6E5A9|nr:30S ribosomal protein S12 methylthiotransferase RimO [Desulfogranum mediterraneum]